MKKVKLGIKGYEQDCILISGSEGSILIENNKLTLRSEEGITFEEVIEDDQGYKEEFEDFYRGIRLGEKVKSSFYEGYKDLQVIIGAINSTSKWKNLELKWFEGKYKIVSTFELKMINHISKINQIKKIILHEF